MPSGSKPGERRGGRQKGTPNKLTRSIIDAIDHAFEQVGGSSYLERVAKDDPKAFCALLGRRIPKDVNLGVQGGLKLSINLSTARRDGS